MQPQTASDRRIDLEIVDVRDPQEWDAGHIAGSHHIPIDELAGRVAELRSGAVVTVCRTGRRSSRAVEVLRSLGIEADHVEGGLAAWSELGLPLVTTGGGPGTVAPPEAEHDHDGHGHHHEHDHDKHGHEPHEHARDEHGHYHEHDHEGHEQGTLGSDVQQRVMGLLAAAQEHFGEREPSEEEARAFFRDLLASEGKTQDEIDEILA